MAGIIDVMLFNEAKATQAASHLLRKHGGTMNYLLLIKLLYLSDREALDRWEFPITTDVYVSMKHGPVLSQLLDRITEEPTPSARPSYFALHIGNGPGRYDVRLIEDPGDGLLSEAEADVLDEIYEEFGHRDRWEVVEYTHSLPEWTDPQGGALPIAIADILRTLGKSEETVHAVEEELAAMALTDRFRRPQ